MDRRFSIVLIAAFMLVVAACSGGDGEASTTTTSADAGTVTSLGAAGGDGGSGGTDTTAAGSADVATTTTVVAGGNPPIPEFEILERQTGEDGDTVVVLLDPGSYTSLNDIDLRNVIAEVVEDFPPVYEAHIIDDERAAPLLFKDDLTAEEQQLLNNYYLAHLDEGFRITFEGPFSDIAATVLGS